MKFLMTFHRKLAHFIGNFQIYKKSQTGRTKSGPFSKVVRLSAWSHSKVPLYMCIWLSQDNCLLGSLNQ